MDLKSGTVYWITGLSGAGKTTIGNRFYNEYRKSHLNTVLLDGDELRVVFGGDLGYTREERLKCAMRYSRMCKMLAEQGINVIICTISMFHLIRDWNRKNIENYKEIYIKVPIDVLKQRNQKGLYSASEDADNVNVMGVQIEFEEPREPDLIIENDGCVFWEELMGIMLKM